MALATSAPQTVVFNERTAPDFIDSDCIICGEDFETTPLRKIVLHTFKVSDGSQGSHAYHEDCLIRWIITCAQNGVEASCPFCKQLIDRTTGVFKITLQSAWNTLKAQFNPFLKITGSLCAGTVLAYNALQVIQSVENWLVPKAPPPLPIISAMESHSQFLGFLTGWAFTQLSTQYLFAIYRLGAYEATKQTFNLLEKKSAFIAAACGITAAIFIFPLLSLSSQTVFERIEAIQGLTAYFIHYAMIAFVITNLYKLAELF